MKSWALGGLNLVEERELAVDCGSQTVSTVSLSLQSGPRRSAGGLWSGGGQAATGAVLL